MKKNCLFAALAAMVAASACLKESTPAESVPSREYRYTFSLDENTKALFDENRVVWEEGDLIGAYAVSLSEVSANRSGAVHRGNPCTFTVSSSIALTAGDAVYAYAPWTSAAGNQPAAVSLTVPAMQRQDASGFDADALPLVALPYTVEEELEAGTDTPVADLQFVNIAALARVSIWSSDAAQASETVQSVRFDSQEGLSGTGTLDLTSLDVSDASSFALTGCSGTSVTTAVAGLSGLPAAKNQAHTVLMGVNPGLWSGTITVVTDKADYVFTLGSPVLFERSKIRPVSLDLAHAGDILVDEQVGFDVVRAAAGDGTTVLTNRLLGCRAYIEGLIVGDSGNPNMDHNLQYGTTVDGYAVTAVDTSATGAKPNANNIYTTENDRTNYIEALDGSCGFRLKFAAPALNTCSRQDKVRIWLDGVRIVKETAPERYTLYGLSSIERISAGEPLPVKSRTLSALTDDDVYTWVTLTDMEFQIKRGAYANVREYDAIANPVNADLPVATNQARRAKDGAANLLYDKEGNGIYMLVNMNCDWRWNASGKTRKQVPRGTGDFSGILVHQQMERWSDDIGRYSIRPVDEDDIAISSSAASNWNDLVEWTFTKKTWSVGQYSWNTATSATGGYITSGKYTDAQLVREVLNATTAAGMTNNTGSVARLYTDNLKMFQNQTSNSLTGYPVLPAWGYRGFNVSNPTVTTISNNTDQLFGMSAGSIIEFLVNYCGFYDWDGDNWTGDVNGIVAEFSTAGVSGSEAAVSFSIAGGMLNRSNANNISWQNAYSFPVDWAVEYATSEDGSSWSSWSKAVNAATGRTDFELRGVPFAVTDANSYASFHATATVSPFYTNIDNGFGLTPYRFILPASVLGKTGVKVRLVPTSLRMATWNVGSGNWYKGLTYRGEKITPAFEIPNNHNGAICIEDLLIQYK